VIIEDSGITQTLVLDGLQYGLALFVPSLVGMGRVTVSVVEASSTSIAEEGPVKSISLDISGERLSRQETLQIKAPMKHKAIVKFLPMSFLITRYLTDSECDSENFHNESR
jgi:hypothetical protein